MRLTTKLVLYISAITFIIALLTLLIDWHSSKKRHDFEMNAEITRVAHSAAILLREPLFALDLTQMSEVTNSIMEQTYVYSVKIELPQANKVVLQKGYPDKRKEKIVRKQKVTKWYGGEFEDTIGYVTIYYDKEALNKQLVRKIVVRAVEWIIFFSILSISIMLLIRLSVIKPLLKIVAEIEKFTYSTRFNDPVKNKTEVFCNEIGAIKPSCYEHDAIKKALVSLAAELELEKEKLILNESRRKHSERLESVGRMTNGIGHEIKNILTTISSAAEILSVHLKGNLQLEKYVNVMQSSLEKGIFLSRKISIFSRLRFEEMAEISAHAIIDSALLLVKVTVPPKIEVRIEYYAHQYHLLGNEGELQNLLINLVMNSRDAIGDKSGVITVSTRNQQLLGNEKCLFLSENLSSGDFFVLRVSDTGCGIPADNIDKIFDPFFTTKENGSGTGLGLTTVFNTVKAHKGLIFVESLIGSQTTFDCYFPIARLP